MELEMPTFFGYTSSDKKPTKITFDFKRHPMDENGNAAIIVSSTPEVFGHPRTIKGVNEAHALELAIQFLQHFIDEHSITDKLGHRLVIAEVVKSTREH
jgi:hypothetical protein